ncbi:MAG: hypothetical protein ACE5EN_11570 [Nitrospinota bacterium]
MNVSRFIPLSVFAVAFALVEAAVVIYLRRLFYPDGFAFPLKPFDPDILNVEMFREAATLAMLGAAGAMTGKNGWQKFAFFIYAFGLWDIFYYVWLKIFMGWPESFLTPDLLFLLPVVWWGPVLAPMIVGASLCGASIIIIYQQERGKTLTASLPDAALLGIGAAVILYTFMIDAPLIEAGKPPPDYRWTLFFAGEVIGWAAFIRMITRGKS